MGFTKREIVSNTLGGLFKKARLSQELELEEVAKQIGIEVKYLESLEADDFYKLPSPTYAQGFLKRYAEFLKLDSQEILKKWDEKYKYRDEVKKNKNRIKKTYQLNQFSFKIILVLIVFCLILVYLGFGIKKALFSPEIEIFEPAKDIVIKDSSLIIKGKTNHRAVVFINDQPVEQIQNGIFEQKIELMSGLNLIKISAKKKYSKETVVYYKVVVTE